MGLITDERYIGQAYSEQVHSVRLVYINLKERERENQEQEKK